MPPRDPKLRPYRMALWAVYFGVVAVVGGLMVWSVARNLTHASVVHHGGPLPTRAALRVCLTDLDGLWREQNQRAWSLSEWANKADPVRAWNDWSKEWEAKVADLSDRCHLDTESSDEGWAQRQELAAARDAMLALHRSYTLQVNRFAEESGDLAQAAAEALRHARESIEK